MQTTTASSDAYFFTLFALPGWVIPLHARNQGPGQRRRAPERARAHLAADLAQAVPTFRPGTPGG